MHSHSYPEGAALRQVYDALCQAQDCIRGETPEDISDEAAREDTIDKIRDGMRAIEAMQSRGVVQASRMPISQDKLLLLRHIDQAKQSIVAATVGSCECNTKSPEAAYHAGHCRYLKLLQALDCLDDAAGDAS